MPGWCVPGVGPVLSISLLRLGRSWHPAWCKGCGRSSARRWNLLTGTTWPPDGRASTRGWRPGAPEIHPRTQDCAAVPPYGLEMNSPATPAGIAELDRARGRERVAYRVIRGLAVTAVGFGAATSFQARPAPGGHGSAVRVSAALIAVCGATIIAMWPAPPRLARQLAVLLIAVAGAAAPIGLKANRAAFLGVF